MSLKQKTITGLKWSFVERISYLLIQFIIGVVLARLLLPREFGLIGMIIVFIAIAKAFIDGGFSQALIRKTKCSQEDYCTVFYFNFFIGLFIYGIFFVSAKYISNFYNEPQLINIIKALGLLIVIESFTIVQRTILIKNIDFKLQTKISFISSIISGLIAIALAFGGLGVWSLVWQNILRYLLMTLLLWYWNSWKPELKFSNDSFKELFGFGSKLLFSSLIDTVFQNLYYLIIGKFFSAAELGFYTKADQFNKLPSQNLDQVVQRVSYPVLSELQDNDSKLKNAYKKLIKNTMFISFIIMIILIAIAKPFILALIGEKWKNSIPILQLLCVGGMLYPLHSLNLNMLKVKGRSKEVLKLEVIKKILVIPTIIIGILMGVKVLIIGIIVNSFIAYFINSYWSGKLINYSVVEQIMDITPSFLVAAFNGILIWVAGLLLSSLSQLFILIIQIFLSVFLISSISIVIKLDVFFEIKDILKGLILKGKTAYASR